LADGQFRACIGAFAALGADHGPIFSGIREFCLDAQRGFLRVDLVEVLDGANLLTEAAAGAIIFINSYPHLNLLVFGNSTVTCDTFIRFSLNNVM
jgi:hypothetical protein